ncbi:LysR family transcriptional regulator [Pseudomonas helleri]|jgi:DNA-binding transcriptional LysR family regulator|uniref:LysR family transcriptional regulator n=1 Tax=Pseudomonas helleri TaxID=1608996 RepID=A0A6A7Z3C6_9PSED|nr:LysR family transcriptional regulator [Pseudomonas helleri]KMN23519.1 LysR family transcriptional regulator [Pseudomonas helleri]MQT35196.1 LysR family transcriptional regulator [Pseudomonas helleri]MQU20266.1 LysR family transcriptional regulator [Pseudomonas helleri]MQU41877.1 LysR family transcriptional regulator [Pseudomonas helleri]MQU56944.1 LysR family transcriptional regulator [Pseudomonas helleri]
MRAFSPQLLEGVDVMAAVVDTRSFGGAALVLDMSQSGVSRAVARLETRLGIRIFERTTRSVRLTEEGRHFYEQVMPLIGALAEVTSSAAGDAQMVQGRLRINVDPLFARFILGPRLGPFLDRYPDLELDMRSKEDLGDLVADGFDLALRFGHPLPSSLVARKLFDTRVLAMASPAYLERFGHPTDPRELENTPHRCILFREPVTGKPFAWEFHQKRKQLTVKPQGQLTVNDPGTVYSACLAGLGIAQLFELGIEQYTSSNQLVQLFPEWSDQRFPLYAYYPSRHHVPAKTRALLSFVMDLIK